jgi:hypothetical protein
MKTVILAATLATTAALPKYGKLMNKEMKDIVKEAGSAKMDQKEVVKKALAERVIGEQDIDKDGQLNVQSYDMNYFEIAAGVNGCDMNDRDETFGVGAYQCWDGIWQKSKDHGIPESMMFFKPNNGGFPFFALFNGHGCNWNNAYWFDRMRKAPFGFPGTYSPWHGCYAHVDDEGTTVYHASASWVMGPHMDYDGAIFSDSRSHKACYRGKVGFYETMRADRCITFDEDDEVTSEKMIVHACDEATNSFNVEVKHYSDAHCTNLVDTETHMSPEICLFDPHYFKESIMHDEYAHFEYSNKTCFKAPPLD